MTHQLMPHEEAYLNTVLNEVIQPALAAAGINPHLPLPYAIHFRLHRGQRTDDFYCHITTHTILARIGGEMHWLKEDNPADKEFLLLSLGRSLRAYFLSKGGRWYR